MKTTAIDTSFVDKVSRANAPKDVPHPTKQPRVAVERGLERWLRI
jgi:hypothetical protein